MSNSKVFSKDPNQKSDFGVNWADWLGADTISVSAWTVPVGITQSASPAPSNTATVATIWLEGGTLGTNYALLNRITTAAGRINDQTIHIKVVSN